MRAPARLLSGFSIALVVALAFLVVPGITDSGQQASANGPFYSLIYYDGHMHTTRSDGNGTVAQIKATAQARGLSAVIVTDHCKDLTLAEWQSLIADTAAATDGSFVALPGFEMTGSEGIFNRGHMNAYNAADPFVGNDADLLCPEEVWPDPFNPAGTGPVFPENFAEWTNYVHSQGGIVQHNHTSGTTQTSYGVNLIEIYNQGHVDDIVSYAMALGIDPATALGLAITMNNFAVYGERDLSMTVTLPGFPPMPLRLAIYMATQFIPPNVGQIMGWNPPTPPNPYVPGDLNSWDELLMAYVNGVTDTPTFGTANSDSHNTGDPGSTVGVAKNGLLVTALTPAAIYEAIGAGRMFATTGPSLSFDVNGKLMGETLYTATGEPTHLNLSVNSASPTAILVKIDIIKNGAILQTLNPMAPSYAGVIDDTASGTGYYRVEVTSLDMVSGEYYFAYSNPVFIGQYGTGVGGTVELRDGTSAPSATEPGEAGPPYIPLAAAVAVGAIVLGGSVWYARRRWAK